MMSNNSEELLKKTELKRVTGSLSEQLPEGMSDDRSTLYKSVTNIPIKKATEERLRDARTMLPYKDFNIIDYMKKFIGQRLRTLRQAKNQTLKDTATLIGIHFVALRRYEIGESILRDEHLRLISKYYQVEPFLLDINALIGKFDYNGKTEVIRWLLGQYSVEYVQEAYQKYLKDNGRDTYLEQDSILDNFDD